MGVGAAGRAGERDHGARPTRCRLRRDGEPGRERPGRPPSDQAGTHHVHLSRGGALGDGDEQKAGIPASGEQSHAQVYSTADSPVEYNAFDHDLQLWVGGVPLQGRCRRVPLFVGEMDEETAERHYREGMALGTTSAGARRRCGRPTAPRSTSIGRSRSAKVHIDDAVREYLWPIAAGRMRGVNLPTRGCSGVGQLRPVDHDRLSAATVPRRDEACRGMPAASAGSTG